MKTAHYPVPKRITIYDVFGFYQTSFVQIVSSLVPLGLATEEEVERMRKIGGRIELIKQGSDEGGTCDKWDEKSSYPDKCVILPSMIGGFWVKREFMEFDWADVENGSPLSMFCIKWHLPERYIDGHGNMQIIPFYALPYRLESGGIRFFSRGYGWYRRDDVVFLKR